jgi:hypothetical protein
MEVSCPKCKQRLRYSDELKNPLLRCRSCSTTFRPSGLTSAVEEPVAAVAVDEESEFASPLHGSFNAPLPKIDPGPVTASRGNKSRFGYFAIILFVVLFKVVPRVAREFFREPKPAQPAQMQQDDQQAIQRMLQEAAKNAENARRQPQIQPMPMPEIGGRFDATE